MLIKNVGGSSLKSTRGIGIGISYLNTALNMICGLFLSSFLIRILGDQEYGLYQTISAFATYLVLLEFGTGTVMSRNISVCRANGKNEDIDRNISTVWFITLALSFIILIVSGVFYFSIDPLYQNTMSADQIIYAKKIFVLVTVYLIFSFLTQTLNGALLGYEQYVFAEGLKCIKHILRTSLLVAIIFFERYSIFIALVDMILSIAIFIATLCYCKKRYNIKFEIRKFDKHILVEALPFCLALMIQSLVNQANNNVDKFVIGIIISMESVAIYSVSQYIYSIFSSVTTVPISMYLPQVAKHLGEGKRGREFTDTLIEPCRLVVFVGGAILFGFFAVGQQFIKIVYGANYTSAWIYALIIMIPMFINMTNGVLVNALDVLKKRTVRSCILLMTTVLNVILTVVLIKRIGIIGAVIATAIATFLGQVLIMNIYYDKKLGIKVMRLFVKSYKGIIPIYIAASVIGYFASKLISNVYLSFIVGGIIFVGLSVVLLPLFGFDPSEKKKAKSLLIKVKQKIFART